MRKETDRLILREYTIEDWEAVHVYGCDSDVLRYMLWGPNTPEESKGFVSACLAESNVEPRLVYNLAIELKESGSLIGGVALMLQNNEGEIGWILNKTMWGKGYATEAALGLIRYGFETLGVKKITATCDADNIASYKVMLKCGMTQIGFQKEARLSSHFMGLRDQRLFELTQTNYLTMALSKNERI